MSAPINVAGQIGDRSHRSSAAGAIATALAVTLPWGSLMTRRWRKPDSNPRSPQDGRPFRDSPFRLCGTSRSAGDRLVLREGPASNPAPLRRRVSLTDAGAQPPGRTPTARFAGRVRVCGDPDQFLRAAGQPDADWRRSRAGSSEVSRRRSCSSNTPFTVRKEPICGSCVELVRSGGADVPAARLRDQRPVDRGDQPGARRTGRCRA